MARPTQKRNQTATRKTTAKSEPVLEISYGDPKAETPKVETPAPKAETNILEYGNSNKSVEDALPEIKAVAESQADKDARKQGHKDAADRERWMSENKAETERIKKEKLAKEEADRMAALTAEYNAASIKAYIDQDRREGTALVQRGNALAAVLAELPKVWAPYTGTWNRAEVIPYLDTYERGALTEEQARHFEGMKTNRPVDARPLPAGYRTRILSALDSFIEARNWDEARTNYIANLMAAGSTLQSEFDNVIRAWFPTWVRPDYRAPVVPVPGASKSSFPWWLIFALFL